MSSATIVFKLPDVGEGLVDAEIVQWHAEEGSSVKAGEPIVSIETDKAIVDIPSPQTGTLLKRFVAAGDILAVGKPLAEFGTETGQPENKPDSSSTTVAGEIPSGGEQLVEHASSIESIPTSAARIMPAVRALAMKHDVDLSLVTPSGRDSTITKADVERVARRLEKFGPPEKLRGTRRAMAITMSRSHSEVVPASLMDEVDVQEWGEGTDVTCRLLRAMVAAGQADPALNTWYDGQAMTRRVFEKMDVALAMDTRDGLFTPVLRDVANLQDSEIRENIEQFKSELHERTISRELLRDFTITLSNYGTLAGRFAVAVVVPPTVAIVGAGKIYDGLRVINGQATVRRLLPLSLTFDHRAVTGGEAGRFLEAMKLALSDSGEK